MSVDVAMSPWHFPDVRFFEAKETDSNFPSNPLVTFSIHIFFFHFLWDLMDLVGSKLV